MTTAMSEQNTHREAAVQQQQAAAQPRNLNAELQVLAKFGGFNVLESSVDGIQNLNPERKARRNIFLTDPERASERKELEKRLEMWVDMLQGNKSISEMIELCQKKSAAVSDLLSQNQLKAVEEVKQLEKSYRTVMLFYKNTDSDKIKNISIVNASMEQLTDLDNSFFIDAIADELRANYDRLDLRTNYSLLVIPGYLGSNKVIEKWAKIAHDNKVMIYTDFADLEKPDDVIEMFFDSNLSGGRCVQVQRMYGLQLPGRTWTLCRTRRDGGLADSAFRGTGGQRVQDGDGTGHRWQEIRFHERGGRSGFQPEEERDLRTGEDWPDSHGEGIRQGDGVLRQDVVQRRQPGLADLFGGTCVRLGDQGIDGLPQPARFRELEQQGGEGFAWTNQQVPGQYPGSRTPD